MSEPLLEVTGLEAGYGKKSVLQGISLRVGPGEIVALLGHNGAGKSTTLRMLYTVLRPDSGAARIDGIDVLTDPLGARRSIGVLPHSAGIYPNLSARENIRFYGELHGLSPVVLEHRLEELVDQLGMSEFADRPARGFSQGQRIKVALARALVHSPRNVLLDEPTNGLDVMATRALRDLILGLKANGHCVLFSSHVMQEVAALCDEIVIIDHGRVICDGTPAGIQSRFGGNSLEEAFVRVLGEQEGLA